MAAYTMPDSMEVSHFLEKPGWYHFIATDVNDAPTSQKGDVVDALKVSCQVLAGTEASQKKREFSPWLNNPNPAHKDGGAFCNRVHLRLARALGILPQAKPGEAVEIVWANGQGRQFVAKVVTRTNQDGREGLQIDGAHIYHVSDDEVKDVPKDAAALKAMGVTVKAAGATTPATANGNGHAASAPATSSPAPAATTPQLAAASTVSSGGFDDL